MISYVFQFCLVGIHALQYYISMPTSDYGSVMCLNDLDFVFCFRLFFFFLTSFNPSTLLPIQFDCVCVC